MDREAELGGRFADLTLIGEGGVAQVYRAVDRITGQVVALKLLRDLDERSAERFEQEARVLAQIAHPHVVRHVAHGVTRSAQPYLAREWVAGRGGRARAGRGPPRGGGGGGPGA